MNVEDFVSVVKFVVDCIKVYFFDFKLLQKGSVYDIWFDCDV